MKEERGRAAVWEHAAEAGMQEDIKRIAAVFPIADVAIFTPGKLTYLDQRPTKPKHTIRPFESDVYVDVATGRLLPRKGNVSR